MNIAFQILIAAGFMVGAFYLLAILAGFVYDLLHGEFDKLNVSRAEPQIGEHNDPELLIVSHLTPETKRAVKKVTSKNFSKVLKESVKEIVKKKSAKKKTSMKKYLKELNK